MRIGQNVYLKKRIEENYLFVDKTGGTGGGDSYNHNYTSDYKKIHGKPRK